MTDKCPTCLRPLAPDGTIGERIVRQLATYEGLPVSAAALSRQLGVQRTTMYQTLRRMADRGQIRKFAHPRLGVGWIIVQQEGTTPLGHPSIPLSPENAEREINSAVFDLVQYAGAIGGLTRERAVEFIRHMLGLPEEKAGELVDRTVAAGALVLSGELLVEAGAR